jgi:hypothetical protein
VSPTRWQRVQHVYSEALDRDPPARPAFVVDACAGDEELRKEVQSLLAEADRCSGFLSSPGFESALRSIVSPDPALPNPAPMRAPRRPAFFWFAIAIGLAMIGLYVCTCYVVYKNSGGKDFGWESGYSREGWTAVQVYAASPASGKLQPGDRILAFNGDARAAKIGPEPFRQFLSIGSNYSIRISRRISGNYEPHEYTLRVGLWQDWGTIPRSISYIVLSLVNFAAGLAMALLKPRGPLARLGFVALMLAVLRNLATPLSAQPGTPPDMEFILNQIVAFSFPCALAVAYHFFHRMSAESAPELVWRVINGLLYGVSGVLAASQLAYLGATLRGREALINFAWRRFWIAELDIVFLKTSWEIFLAVAFGAICAVIVWGYYRSKDANHRRQIRWFAAGCTVGMAPELVLNLIGSVLLSTGHRVWLESSAWHNLRWTADQLMVALPISLAYGVLKHRLLDISVVVRRGLRYILARRMLQAILILPVLGLLWPVVSHPDMTLRDLLLQSSSVINLLLLALVGISLKYRRQMRAWLDRRFFREAYRQEDILRRLIHRIGDVGSAEEVSSLVCKELDTALHPKWLYVCQWKSASGKLAVVQSSRNGPIQSTTQVPAEALELLRICKVSQECTMKRPEEVDPTDERLLVIPIHTSSATPAGALLLGEKKSEESYSQTDRHLLDGIASAIGVALENVWLRKRVDEGLRERREVLARLDRDSISLLKECPECGACFDSIEDKCPNDSSSLILSLPVERTIEQRYRLDRRIGKGGMGLVFEATDLTLSRQVAVKVMIGHLFGDQSAVRRFEREARILGHISHPNIVAIHDFGRLGGEGAYLVMERLTGPSWRNELRRLGSIAPVSAAVWFDQLLGGLNAAHEAGVIHRDLKPENVIVSFRADGGELIKILDFGVAKMRSQHPDAMTRLTETGVVMGTLAYMSPEQIRGEPADERSDIFSVGVMAVEAITGKLPRRNGDGTVIAGALSGQLGVEDGARKSALRQILFECLADNPERRRSPVTAIRRDLVSALRSG